MKLKKRLWNMLNQFSLLKMGIIFLIGLFPLMGLAKTLASKAAQNPLEVKNFYRIESPRVFLPTPGKEMTSGYLTLHNLSDKKPKIRLLSMSPFKSVETHETIKMENSFSKMVQVEFFEVEPKAKLELVPGGKHLMLFESSKKINLGEKLKGTLKIDEKEYGIEFDVINRVTAPPSTEHQHH